MADLITCPACGFPNFEGSHSCISCQSPLGHVAPQGRTAGAGARLGPAASLPAGPVAPTTGGAFPYDKTPQTPDEILERIRQVRGEDATKSLEMLAIPDLKSAVDADLAAERTESPAPSQSPPASLPRWRSPTDVTPAQPWVIDHRELRATEVSDPWAGRFAQYPTAGATPSRRETGREGFRPIDLVPAVGVVAVLGSVNMPWISVHGGVEGRSLGPASLPMTLLVKGISESYPLPWLTATVVMVVLALVAVLGLAFPRNQAAATGLTIAGMLTILVPATFLVRFALSGEMGIGDETAYVAAPGLYVAVGAALLLLLGATLRGSKTRS